MLNLVKKINLKIIYILTAVIILFMYLFFSFSFIKNTEIETIQSVAKQYFEQNKNYGFEVKPGELSSCAGRNLFLRNATITDIFAQPDIDIVSCKFKITNSEVTEWSVSIVKGETVYCGDSIGNNTQTPGLTTTANCKGE